MQSGRPKLTLVACLALSTVLGSVHAFSVFVPEWEQIDGSRAGVSLIYSLALISLTLAVLFGYRLYQHLSPAAVFLLSGILAALGLTVSAYSQSVHFLYLTYGILFGAANGIGYGYALQLSGQTAPEYRGLAMCLVTAFYAVGATVSPLLLVYLIGLGGNALALKLLAGVVLVVSVFSAVLLLQGRASYTSEPSEAIESLSPKLQRARMLLWVAYGSAVTAGLMVIGHAYSIVGWLGQNEATSAWAATIIAFGNMLGGFSAGYYSDRFSNQALLKLLPLASLLGLLLLIGDWALTVLVSFAGLAIVGYCYGAIIAIYPVAVTAVFGTLSAARIYGQVFTAWGLAGLLGPWISGYLFDVTQSYKAALALAMVLSCISIFAIQRYSASIVK